MLLKKKDKVIVLSGKEKGKRGEVIKREGEDYYVVAKLNMVKRHQKARQQQKGGIVEKEAPIHQSKLMLVCPSCDSPTRAGIKILDDGTKTRVCRECSETLS